MAGLYERDQVLKLQEVGDVIFNAQSGKVPFSKLVKRGKPPKQLLSEWPVQKYPRRGFVGTMDGSDVSTFESTNRDKLSAYGMLMRTAGWQCTKLAGLTATAGVPNKQEKAKQMKDDGLILAQMIERQLLSNDDTQAEASPATPYCSRGVFSWLSPSAQTVLPVDSKYRPAAACRSTAALSALTSEAFEACLEAAALDKMEAVDLTGFVGLKLKARMSKWQERMTEDTGIESRSVTSLQTDKKLISVVNFFEFDSGLVRTFPSFYLRCTAADGEDSSATSRSGAFLDMSMWELCFLEAPAVYELPDLGGGPRGYHDATYILKNLNPTGQVVVESTSD